ncbi:hypothetical protein [Desulfosporosinus meridiei]|uniref:Peptidase MA-like domain-containing protein n=1 Tax=Desulfosporosinus meridiei (strain ATCC BAA-275 / DSM 13257 / KCTC 12902 / NCIMB 13706 / S10) TaxID=768704 RepID=J7IXV7_DESMD|nr:hypothetical protein [Desulfosporosinus meridiei]AFQ43536.1 hypothetical protein Desmer_1544 [Desulfosporosinus meridiei DSM 13257]
MKARKVFKCMLIVLSIILLIAIIQYIPALFLQTPDMQIKEGKYVCVYFQKGDEKGAQEVFDLLELTSKDIRQKLGFTSSAYKTKMYIYKSQSTFQMRKFGLVTLIFAPKWYIGDNKDEIALMVSPYAKVEVHDHDGILSAAPHEMIHTINYLINPRLSYWIDNGVAGYLSNQVPQSERISRKRVPAFQDIQTENEIKFGTIGGYDYSYSYIEYLDKTYGWDKVVEIVKGGSYQDAFSKSEKEIYDGWVKYLK